MGQFKGQIRSPEAVRGASGFACFEPKEKWYTHTHTYEFLWSTAAISASDQTRARVWEPSDASNTPRSIVWKDAHTSKSGSQKGHMLTRKTSAALFVSANWCRWSGCRWVQASRRWEGACGCRDNSRPSPWEERRRRRNTLSCTPRGKLHRIRLQMVDIYK